MDRFLDFSSVGNHGFHLKEDSMSLFTSIQEKKQEKKPKVPSRVNRTVTILSLLGTLAFSLSAIPGQFIGRYINEALSGSISFSSSEFASPGFRSDCYDLPSKFAVQ